MKFSDNKERTALFRTFVKRSSKEMEARDEANSNLVDIEKYNIGKKLGKMAHLYKIPARDVKIGETIFDKNGKRKAYRVS